MMLVAHEWLGQVLLLFSQAIVDVESEKIARNLNMCWDLETILIHYSIMATCASQAILLCYLNLSNN
jgi:hypothetical protein